MNTAIGWPLALPAGSSFAIRHLPLHRHSTHRHYIQAYVGTDITQAQEQTLHTYGSNGVVSQHTRHTYHTGHTRHTHRHTDT